ncbi:uncharacterized protein N7483_002944 [Penicillium malachiteum]|uniref:uncharacterized protein n=1 Tax=Penicillium malachiteum TaxID=1324776 RepID=UPI0025491B7A|nr:uncharacterized protein N7483_002944 [Penicillium malachiteum]KAJ5737819.1 hypothetical protein N7483_002944 [Penicillium malachiteum]
MVYWDSREFSSSRCPIAVNEVYSVRPKFCEKQLEDVFTLAEMWDYREKLVRAAVTNCVRMEQQAHDYVISQGDANAQEHSEGLWTIDFDDVREKHADSDNHFVKWQQQGLSPNEPHVEV